MSEGSFKSAFELGLYTCLSEQIVSSKKVSNQNMLKFSQNFCFQLSGRGDSGQKKDNRIKFHPFFILYLQWNLQMIIIKRFLEVACTKGFEKGIKIGSTRTEKEFFKTF